MSPSCIYGLQDLHGITGWILLPADNIVMALGLKRWAVQHAISLQCHHSRMTTCQCLYQRIQVSRMSESTRTKGLVSGLLVRTTSLNLLVRCQTRVGDPQGLSQRNDAA